MYNYLKRVELPPAPRTRCEAHLAARVADMKKKGKWGKEDRTGWSPHLQPIAPFVLKDFVPGGAAPREADGAEPAAGAPRRLVGGARRAAARPAPGRTRRAGASPPPPSGFARALSWLSSWGRASAPTLYHKA